MEHLVAVGIVAETNVLEDDPLTERRNDDRAGRQRQAGVGVQQLLHPVGGGGGALDDGVDLGQLLEGLVHEVAGHTHRDDAHKRRSLQVADHQEQTDDEGRRQLEAGAHQHLGDDRLLHRPEVGFAVLAETCLFLLLGVVGLDHADAGQILLEEGHQGGDATQGLAGIALDPAAGDEQRHNDQRRRDAEEQGHAPKVILVGIGGPEEEGRGDHEGSPRQIHDTVGDAPLDAGRVVSAAADELANVLAAEEAEALAVQRLEQGGAEVDDDARSQPAQAVVVEDNGDETEDDKGQHQDDTEGQEAQVQGLVALDVAEAETLAPLEPVLKPVRAATRRRRLGRFDGDGS